MRKKMYVKKKMVEATGIAKVIDEKDEYVEIPFVSILRKPDVDELVLKLHKKYKYAAIMSYEFNDIVMEMELDKFVEMASYIKPHQYVIMEG